MHPLFKSNIKNRRQWRNSRWKSTRIRNQFSGSDIWQFVSDIWQFGGYLNLYSTVLYLYSIVCKCPYVQRFRRCTYFFRSGHIIKSIFICTIFSPYEQILELFCVYFYRNGTISSSLFFTQKFICIF